MPHRLLVHLFVLVLGGFLIVWGTPPVEASSAAAAAHDTSSPRLLATLEIPDLTAPGSITVRVPGQFRQLRVVLVGEALELLVEGAATHRLYLELLASFSPEPHYV